MLTDTNYHVTPGFAKFYSLIVLTADRLKTVIKVSLIGVPSKLRRSISRERVFTKQAREFNRCAWIRAQKIAFEA